jgi:oligoribonuclease (3'-5' exoribonuclease)
LEIKAAITSKNLAILQGEVQKLGNTLNEFIADMNEFKQKVVETKHLVSYIVFSLLVGKGVIVNTRKFLELETETHG